MEDMKEQVRWSGLVLGNNNQDEPQWNIKYGLRQQWKHASVVIQAPHNEKEEIIVVLGGKIEGSSYSKSTNTVSLLNSDGSKYEQCPRGPSMNERRVGLAGVFCNGCVYAIGGLKRDSMERIQVSDLLSSAYWNKSQKETPWEKLKCRLSTTQRGSCSATVVQNRYIVIGRGHVNGSVDIVDTAQASQPFIFQGPALNVPRSKYGMAAVGSRVYVIGGRKIIGRQEKLTSVEYLDLLPVLGSDGRDSDESDLAPSLSWKMHQDLVLPIPQVCYSVVRVGSCLVVLGGRNDTRVRSVEVLDTKRNKVWGLPDLRDEGGELSAAVAVFNGIVVLGGDMASWKTFAILPLMDKNSAVYKCLLDSPSLNEID